MSKVKTSNISIKVAPELKDHFVRLCQEKDLSQAVLFQLLLASFEQGSQHAATETKSLQATKDLQKKTKILDKQLKILQYQAAFNAKLLLQQATAATDQEVSFSLLAQKTSVDQRIPALFNTLEHQVNQDFGKLHQAQNSALKTDRTDYRYPLRPQQTAVKSVPEASPGQQDTPSEPTKIAPNYFNKSSSQDYNKQSRLTEKANELLKHVLTRKTLENPPELRHNQEKIVIYLNFLIDNAASGLLPGRDRMLYQHIILDQDLFETIRHYYGRIDKENSAKIMQTFKEEALKMLSTTTYSLNDPGIGL